MLNINHQLIALILLTLMMVRYRLSDTYPIVTGRKYKTA
jgi:hypothetical protein